MKKLLFILLFALPLISFSQTIYNEDDVKFNKDKTLILLKSNDNPVSGILKRTCIQIGFMVNIESNCEYVIKNGLWLSSKGYYKNNQISEETQRDGASMFYHKNGQISHVGSLKDGWYDGNWKYYNKKGRLRREDTFKEEKLIKEKYYDKYGNSFGTEYEWTSDNSYILKRFTEGFIYEKGAIKNGKRDGIWKYYVLYVDDTSELEKEITFKDGKKIKVNRFF